MPDLENYDLIILGGGRAAVLATAAAKAGKKTALIERDRLGGVCPNRGCVPSKLLIGFAEAARHVRHADRHFIDAELRGIDTAKLFASVAEYAAGVDPRYEGRLKNGGVTVIRGEGMFSGPKVITVGERRLTAPDIVIATGTRPSPVPAAYAHLPVWTSDSLFPLHGAAPRSLIVIGSGFIGVEMGAFFAGIGTRTMLFARGDRLLGRADADIEKTFAAEFSKEVETHLHATLAELTHDGSGFTAVFDIAGQRQTFQAEAVLFAIGRIPNTEALNLAATGLAAGPRGFIPVDGHLQTSVPGIYAAGDVNGRFMLQHAASYEVQYLRQRLLKGGTAPIGTPHIAHAIFSHPEVASVGQTEDQLKAAGSPYVAVHQDWLNSARAMSLRVEYPRIKLLVSPADYSILGCHLIGPESSTLLHQVMMLMQLKNDVRELAEMVYIHPALNELFLAAAVSAVREVRAHQGREKKA